MQNFLIILNGLAIIVFGVMVNMAGFAFVDGNLREAAILGLIGIAGLTGSIVVAYRSQKL